jgi:hypothetical protein
MTTIQTQTIHNIVVVQSTLISSLTQKIINLCGKGTVSFCYIIVLLPPAQAYCTLYSNYKKLKIFIYSFCKHSRVFNLSRRGKLLRFSS